VALKAVSMGLAGVDGGERLKVLEQEPAPAILNYAETVVPKADIPKTVRDDRVGVPNRHMASGALRPRGIICVMLHLQPRYPGLRTSGQFIVRPSTCLNSFRSSQPPRSSDSLASMLG
jgi:hypothetical protein